MVSKKIQKFKTIDYNLEEKPECIVETSISVLENLKLNYPKIKFEYNESVTKEYDLNQSENSKDYQLDERIK